jgi:GH35 family endo-1,4-beta-xylanase
MPNQRITSFTKPKEKGPKGSPLPEHNISHEDVNDFRETIDKHADALDFIEAKLAENERNVYMYDKLTNVYRKGALVNGALVWEDATITPPVVIPPSGSKMSKLPIRIGVAAKEDYLNTRPEYAAIVNEEFSILGSENHFKWGLQTAEGVWNWKNARKVLDYAKANGHKIHWHCILWPKDMFLPAWLLAYEGTVGAKAKVWSIIRNHIQEIANVTNRDYPGIVISLDVVNEPVNNNGTPLDSFYSRVLGPTWVEEAIKLSNDIWPQPDKYINDYGQEYGQGKTEVLIGYKAKVAALGGRLDGLGWQMHTLLRIDPYDHYRSKLKLCDAAGLKVQITEFDMTLSAGMDNKGYGAYPFITDNVLLRDQAAPIVDMAAQMKKLLVVYLQSIRPSLRAAWIFWSLSDKENFINSSGAVDYPAPWWGDYAKKQLVYDAFTSVASMSDPYYQVGGGGVAVADNAAGSAEIYHNFKTVAISNLHGAQTGGSSPKVWEVSQSGTVVSVIRSTTEAALYPLFSQSNYIAYALIDPWASDYEVSATLERRKAGYITNLVVGLVFRFKDFSNHWFVDVANETTNAKWRLRKMVNGVTTNVIIADYDGLAGDIVKVIAVGSLIKFYLNGSLVGQVTDTTFQTEKRSGMRFKGLLDNYSGWKDFRLDVTGSITGPYTPPAVVVPAPEPEPSTPSPVEIYDSFLNDTDRVNVSVAETLTNGGTEKVKWIMQGNEGSASARVTSVGLQSNGTGSQFSITHVILPVAVNDFTAEAKLNKLKPGPSVTINAALMIRYKDVDNYLFVRVNISNTDSVWQLMSRVAGIESAPILATTASAAEGDILRVVCIGTSVSLYVNNALIGSTQIFANANGKMVGFRFRGAFDTVSAWSYLSVDKIGTTVVDEGTGATSPPVIPPTALPWVADVFTNQIRATLNNTYADSGQIQKLWSVQANAASIIGVNADGLKAAYSSSNTTSIASMDLGKSDFTVTAKLARKTASFSATVVVGLLFRYVDGNNYFVIKVDAKADSSDWHLVRRQAGVETELLRQSGVLSLSGDSVKAVTTGSQITISINDSVIGVITDDFNNTATKVGFIFNGFRDNWSAWNSIAAD